MATNKRNANEAKVIRRIALLAFICGILPLLMYSIAILDIRLVFNLELDETLEFLILIVYTLIVGLVFNFYMKHGHEFLRVSYWVLFVMYILTNRLENWLEPVAGYETMYTIVNMIMGLTILCFILLIFVTNICCAIDASDSINEYLTSEMIYSERNWLIILLFAIFGVFYSLIYPIVILNLYRRR